MVQEKTQIRGNLKTLATPRAANFEKAEPIQLLAGFGA
jgi:hypothetical protein